MHWDWEQLWSRKNGWPIQHKKKPWRSKWRNHNLLPFRTYSHSNSFRFFISSTSVRSGGGDIFFILKGSQYICVQQIIVPLFLKIIHINGTAETFLSPNRNTTFVLCYVWPGNGWKHNCSWTIKITQLRKRTH